jgi:hypothetical protein
MAVRGTSVARHQKLVIIREANEHQGERIWCAWEDCDRYGFANHQVVINEAKPGWPKKLARYVFCSEAHRAFFARSHIPGEYGRLPAGIRGRYNL